MHLVHIDSGEEVFEGDVLQTKEGSLRIVRLYPPSSPRGDGKVAVISVKGGKPKEVLITKFGLKYVNNKPT